MGKVQFLQQDEIDKFVDVLDKDNDGCISYHELEQKLDHVYQELQPVAKHYNLHHASRQDDQRHEFLRTMMRTGQNKVPVEEFKKIVATWEVPSLKQDKEKKKEEDDYLNNMSWARRLRAMWEVNGPEYVFLAMVVGLQIGLGVWQCVKYATGAQYQAAFGWGVGMAKACAGALYPTLFFLILSMSRWYSTLMRRSYYISRFINWDRSQGFHIKISIAALALATIHAIGHLSGSFVFGSRSNRQDAVAALLGPDAVPRPYVEYVRSVPGWSGITALALLYIISTLSMPYIRQRSYEIFQLGHLLMFPFIAMMMAHGSLGLLQYPVMGFVLALPTLLVLIERTTRVLSGFHKIPAKLKVLDDETVQIVATMPEKRLWNYKAGQYLFLQVPELSFFQWHPFTISTCNGRELELHIKTDGDWTGKLRELKDLKYVGIDGPYGAPAQRFYDFDQAIIVGAGIGVTPFSGILNDLQTREDHRWSQRRDSTSSNESGSRTVGRRSRSRSVFRRNKKDDDQEKTESSNQKDNDQEKTKSSDQDVEGSSSPETHLSSAATDNGPPGQTIPHEKDIDFNAYRRVDFHWIVREQNYLLWFSDLLNRISNDNKTSAPDSDSNEKEDSNLMHSPNLDIRLHNHVTKKREDISLHIFRWLLEKHRTPSQPMSPLTGLIAPTSFGRPDFPSIFNAHYEDMMTLFAKDPKRKRKVGVFFCGAPVIGAQLVDLCHQLTLRGREDRSEVEYHFQIEVFG